jgi:cell division protease FtsH
MKRLALEIFKKYQWQFSLVYVLVAAGLLYLIHGVMSTRPPREIPFSELLNEIRAGHVAEINITDRQLIGLLKGNESTSKPSTESETVSANRLPRMDETILLKELEAHQVKFTGHIEARSWWREFLVGWVLPLLILASIYGYGVLRVKQGVGGALTFGKNRAKIYDQSSQGKVTFNDVAGVDEAKAELVEVVDFLKNPQRYQKLGGRIPKGVLLVGPPGTGKTLLAKAVAGEAGAPFFSISGSEFIEMFVGVGAARVRNLFERAKRKAPCIIFIDELDAIGKSRSSDRRQIASHDEREQTLNQLLVEMDGFDTSKGVIIMAATNTPEVLDTALVRTGRFDRQVLIDSPDLQGREAILRVHSRSVTLAPAVNLNTIAARTPGMVGADLANIINEAALLAARRDADKVEMRDLEEAIDRVMLGLEKKSRVMGTEEKERVAYHETGHALVALSVKHADAVHRVSIIPRSIGALGHTLQLPTQEKYLMTKPELEDRISIMLGGRAAEEITYAGVVSTGASNDLERASELVRQIITRFGMSEQLGQLTYGRSHTSHFLQSSWRTEERNYSEHTAEMIDMEARRIIDDIYRQVKMILTMRREELERIARELIRKETLDRGELDGLLAPSSEPAAVLGVGHDRSE